MKIIARVIGVALILMGVAYIVPGVMVANIYVAIIASVVLGLLNLIVRPILLLLTFPITLLTFGLFVFVINALLFWFSASFVDGFGVTGFLPALIGSVIVSIGSTLLHKVLS